MVLIFAALCSCHHGRPGPEVVVSTDLGVLSDASAPSLWRDGGASVLVGNQLLWFFADTIFPFVSVDGTQLRTNTAASASPLAPAALAEPLDANGAPAQFVPFTVDEAAYNARHADRGERFAL